MSEAIDKKQRADVSELDPYALIRPGLSPEHANLSADEISSALGHIPSALALQEFLDSPEMRMATIASLLGKSARNTIRLNGVEISIPVFLGAVSRLCREAAEQSWGGTPASPGESSRTKLPETAVSESFSETEAGELQGESAPWLEESFTGTAQSESEWHDAPSKKKVTDPFSVPFRWICKVSVLKNGKYDCGGTGVLISNRHVLTAAHVVYDVIRDPVQYDLGIAIALDGNKDLGRLARSGKPQIPSLYTPEKTDYDYALVTLNRPVGQSKFDELKGGQLCFWGSPDCGAGTVLVRVDPKSLVTQTAYTAGYPRNKGQSALWCFSGLLAYVGEKDRTMTYTADVTEGQSGSPVWIERDGKSILVGIVVARGTTNRVVRVTRELCRQLASWMGSQPKEVESEQGQEVEQEQEQEDPFLASGVSENVPSVWLGRADSEEPEDRKLKEPDHESADSNSEREWLVSDRGQQAPHNVTPELVLVCGLNYPKFSEKGGAWKPSRKLSAGDWREYGLRMAVNRLTANSGLKVTLFDFLAGTREDVTLVSGGKAATTVVQRFPAALAEDYRDLSGIDWSAPTAAQVMAATIEPIRASYAKKPQLGYFDGVDRISHGKAIKLLDYLNSIGGVSSPSISITDVYDYISGFPGGSKNGALVELHFFSHAFNITSNGYSGGPILVNSLDNPFQTTRHPLDKDARSAKDFQKPVIDPAAFNQAFAVNARSFVWGCNFQQGFIRQFLNLAVANRKTIAANKSISVSLSADWGAESDFRTALGLGPKDPVRGVKVDPTKVREILKDANQGTFMQKLATASGHPAVGAPAGTYADYDDDSSSLKLMHVPMTRAEFGKTDDTFEDALAFYHDELKVTFDTTFGNHHDLGRGYMIFQP
jgi:V8-like Glu-specific endopeptidase